MARSDTKAGSPNRMLRGIVLLLGLWLAIELVARLVADIAWFEEVGYLQTFRLRLTTQVGLFTIGIILPATILLGNLALADHWKHPRLPESQVDASHASSVDRLAPLPLRWLLPLALGLSLLVGFMLAHYAQVAINGWKPDLNQPSISPSLPTRLGRQEVWQGISQLAHLSGQGITAWLMAGGILLLTIALLMYAQFVLTAIALLLSGSLGMVLSEQWFRILQAFNPVAFGQTEPIFERDISFYMFTLPALEILEFCLTGLFLFGWLSVAIVYLLSGNSLSQGKFVGFSQAQQRHLLALTGCVLATIGLRYWLNRYELLYSKRGVVFGVGYTALKVELPAYTILSLLAGMFALLCGYLVWRGFPSKRRRLAARDLRSPALNVLLSGLATYGLVTILTLSVLPDVVQRLAVEPNELGRERPYLLHNIALTRSAFGLDEIDVEEFTPNDQLTYADLQRNELTVRNIRVWDTRPLLQTNRQLQQIRPYYQFPGADIDRYSLEAERREDTAPFPEKQQVLISARELDYSAVPREAQTWVNQHLIYTHGYGFTLSPVNQVGSGGLPYYFVKDIGVPTEVSDNANPADSTQSSGVSISSNRIRDSIPIGRPRIYYGEISNTYVMTGTKVQELDYPSGSDNVYNTYDGRGGVVLSSLWKRGLFALYLKDWQMLFTRNFTPQTRLLFRRNINHRIRTIAPFLRYDSDPYLVTANTQTAAATSAENPTTPNYLYWIVDAYTTSDRYPYSDPGNDPFNYIRNSVKVVIDAYNGSVNFYVAAPKDPIIASLSRIFPDLFKPLDEMPAALRSHTRYPIDLFNTEVERLLTYHMTDPQVFYNREDQWQIPNEIYGNKAQLVEPYYLITKLSQATSEEFILLLPLTPIQRPNLVAWLAARSDEEAYGKRLLYQFPKQELVYGTEQIEARINQDPVISQQISLWNREGSRAIQGNLLIIPIERSLLYVEPLYLEAEQNSLPTLARVIVVYENRIAMAETLEEAIRSVFQPETNTPAIVRPVNP